MHRYIQNLIYLCVNVLGNNPVLDSVVHVLKKTIKYPNKLNVQYNIYLRTK